MLAKVVYWLVVVAVAVGLVVGMILFFESRDQASVGALSAPGERVG